MADGLCEQIKEIQDAPDDILSQANADLSLRVATPLRKMKPEAYIPEIVCFGPYHNVDSYSPGSMISIAQAYKHKSAAILSKALSNRGESFEDIVKMVKEMLPDIRSFYGGKCPDNIALVMTIDLSFLLFFLFGVKFNLPRPEGGQNPVWQNSVISASLSSFCTIYGSSITYDMMKLENQIPLSVLKKVFEKVKEAFISDAVFQDFDRLLFTNVIVVYPPFWMDKKIIQTVNAEERHLLGRIHAYVSQFLQIETGGNDQMARPYGCYDFLDMLRVRLSFFVPSLPFIERRFIKGFDFSAEQLAIAGFKFKSFSNPSDKIRLDKQSGTLYLPQIIVTDVKTELFFRNMVALEFNDANRSKSVSRYLGVMGCLIQSPEDVRLLVDRRIICRDNFALSDESTLKMWNDVRQPFIRTPILLIPDELSEAFNEVLNTNYLKSKAKRTLWGLFDFVWSWKFMAPVGVFLGLVMTAIQTYCTVKKCN